MDPSKSLDESKVIAAALHDVHNVHGSVFNTRHLRLTLNRVMRRYHSEGIGFLTKTLPKLGKSLDQALTEVTPLNATKLGWKAMPGSELPIFMGEFFSRVLDKSGLPLANPCADCVKVLREVLYLFYKYELPYTEDQVQQVLDQFEKTDRALKDLDPVFENLERLCSHAPGAADSRKTNVVASVAHAAKELLADLFADFDPLDINPRHGPGAVATKQKLWEKYQWSNISARITDVYPRDAYFYASLGHVCDSYRSFDQITDESLPARIVLVPKDSRGPRLISCEPVDFQWIQQGLGGAIVRHVERHRLTRDHVHFTDQTRNQIGALLGSISGKYATLDLKEASDRVSVGLVRLLFPEHVYTCLMACRSSSTALPCGRELELNKFAPMGSCLCFPVMALVIWAILAAGCPNAYSRERILVYGDDVIVPTANAANAIELLESFGLLVNRDKSCISGLFRESCGTDAFKDVNVTPVRLRTVWSSLPTAESYASWIAYANSLYDRKYFTTYDYIVRCLVRLYGSIPDDSMSLTCPSLREVPSHARPRRKRWNKNLQKFEFRVKCVESSKIHHPIDGWSMLLRFFAESGPSSISPESESGIHVGVAPLSKEGRVPLNVSSYTPRKSSFLSLRWR